MYILLAASDSQFLTDDVNCQTVRIYTYFHLHKTFGWIFGENLLLVNDTSEDELQTMTYHLNLVARKYKMTIRSTKTKWPYPAQKQNGHIQCKNKMAISSTKTKLPYPTQKQNDHIQHKNKMAISNTKTKWPYPAQKQNQWQCVGTTYRGSKLW